MSFKKQSEESKTITLAILNKRNEVERAIEDYERLAQRSRDLAVEGSNMDPSRVKKVVNKYGGESNDRPVLADVLEFLRHAEKCEALADCWRVHGDKMLLNTFAIKALIDMFEERQQLGIRYGEARNAKNAKKFFGRK